MQMTNNDILKIAAAQSAVDLSCDADDFFGEENKVVISRASPLARKYLKLPFVCNIVYYGKSVVASVDEKYAEAVRKFIDAYPPEHLFETPNMHMLNDFFEGEDHRVCFMAEYFLPDLEKLAPLPCPFETRVLGKDDFSGLYTPEWSNALCADRKELDCLGVGAYEKDGRLIGLAACSADCDEMWQIGIDVLPEYRRRSVASSLTSRLALEILARGKVAFYCAAWSNIASVRNAIRSGFRPAWVEMTVKPREYVDKMNQR